MVKSWNETIQEMTGAKTMPPTNTPSRYEVLNDLAFIEKTFLHYKSVIKDHDLSRMNSALLVIDRIRAALTPQEGVENGFQETMSQAHDVVRETLAKRSLSQYETDMANLLFTAASLYAQGRTQAPITVDDLAQFIRNVDGNNDVGAKALAEKIVEYYSASPAHQSQNEGE